MSETARRGRPRKYNITTTPAAIESPAPYVTAAPELPETVASLKFEDAPSILLIDEAAALLRVSKATVEEWIKRQRTRIQAGQSVENPIPVFQIDRVIRLDRDLLVEWERKETLRLGSIVSEGKA